MNIKERADQAIRSLGRLGPPIAVRYSDGDGMHAGPCGTSACAPAASSFTWTLLMLWPHLAHYYATRPKNPYMKMGAKAGGGNGKGRLW